MKFAILRAHARQQKRFRFGRARKCFWCGKRLIYHKRGVRRAINHPMQATREHVIPRSRGGGGGPNVVAACRACNSRRSSDMLWVPYHKQIAVGLFIPRQMQGEQS